MIARLRHALAQPGLVEADKADLGFALGRILDAAALHDEAFAAYTAANRASRASFGPAFRGYDRAAQERFVDRLIAAFPKLPSPIGTGAGGGGVRALSNGSYPLTPIAAHTPHGGPAMPKTVPPIFICGMFRSGSTLAEQILASHSAVSAGGELDLLPSLIAEELQPYPEAAPAAPKEKIARLRESYLNSLRAIHPDATQVTDKRPDNFLHIGLIKVLFRDAKIVHTVRHPLDNVLSLYFLHLDPGMPYALDLEDAAHWYRQYRRLMAHWKSLYPADIFDLDYDALVADPRPSIGALLRFCGLEWEEECLAFHRSPHAVRTASAWQVREPLYRRASGRWRHYEARLAGVRALLETPWP
jgi:Sulfotransferase family